MPGRARCLLSLSLVLLSLAYGHPQAQTSADVVLRPGRDATVTGAWQAVTDASAADGVAVRHANAGAAKLSQALAQPANYFEVSFAAEANVPYRLWVRGKAQGDSWANDSVFVQFSSSINGSGVATTRIGTTSAYEVNLEDCSGCGLSGWGWQDNGWGVGVLGPEVVFATAGTQRLRVQTREDGLAIDQIVLSPQRYLTTSPGSLQNDTTIVPRDGQTPGITVVRAPYLQRMSSSQVVIVWATRESGVPTARVASASTSRVVTGASRLVPSSRTGLGYDYYHHEVSITGLSPATSYTYDAALGSAAVLSAGFRTAPAPGTGDTSFIVFGDSGTGSTQQQQLATRMSDDTFDVALHAGDIVYGSANGTGDASFQTYNSWFFDIYKAWLPFRAFYPSEGNHDSRPANGNGVAYLDSFTLPANGASAAYPDHAERYYSFDYGRVHFVVLDTEFAFQDPTRRTEQLSWVESDLAATSQPWKIALFHRSPYSAGGEHGSDLAVRAAFTPLFEQYGVQLALSAHEHTYERTRPLRASSTGTAVTYIVSGGGGGPLYPAGTADWTAYSASRHHYVKGLVTDCAITLSAVGLDGRSFDGTTIQRCTQPPAASEVVVYASGATRAGRWVREADTTAAGSQRVRHPDAGAAKIASAAAQPSNYFEVTFDAVAGTPYRLWIRGRADNNGWANDSVFVQFDNSLSASGTAQYRIGTTASTEVNLEDCSGCGLSGWGWQDNGWGVGVRGPLIYFAQSGLQRMRIQTREDGLSIDQIVLSPNLYLTASPGALKNDGTILSPR